MAARRKKHITPVALRSDNETPLNLGELEVYMNMVFDRAAKLEQSLESQRNRDFFFAAGTRASPITPRHASRKKDTILEQRDAASDGLIKVVKGALAIARKTKLHVPTAEIDKNGISRKVLDSIERKVKREYKDDPAPYSRVVDMVRCTLLSETADDIQILSEYFRPCAMPEVVRYQNDFSHINTQRGNIRRLHINVRIPSAGGHIGEIFVYDARGYQHYEKSRKEYGLERDAKAAEERVVLRGADHKTIRSASKAKVRAGQARVNANNLAASAPDIRDLVTNQKSFLIDDFPVVVVESAYEGERYAIVPNPVTGYWETDQRFLDIIENPKAHHVERVIPYDIAVRAQALVESTELSQQLRPSAG